MKDVRVTPTASTAAAGEPVVVSPHDVPAGHDIRLGAVSAPDRVGRRSVEVVVDGWRFEYLVEDAERAALRDRASRDRSGGAGGGGALEIRAIIPGKVVSVAVTPGDRVETGQPLLAVEAMKMQNELRAPRAGKVTRVAAAAGSTVELGDLLVELE